MKNRPFATNTQSAGLYDSTAFDLSVRRSRGQLDDDQSVSTLHHGASVGFTHMLPDSAHPWFMPPAHVTATPELPSLITAATSARSPQPPLGLDSAGQVADYLIALRKSLPPRPFDLHVHRADPSAELLRRLIEANLISTYPSDRGRWINSEETIAFLPTGECLNDPASAWYVSPNHWADRDEVDFLVAEYRKHRPELYPLSSAFV